MVSFLQKNAAKIVIISGAALISTISGGGCDDAECTQDSTLSAKCSAGTDAQKKKCTDIANKAVSTIVLCKGTTCEDSEFASSGRCCIDAPATTTTTVAPPTCATDGQKEANKKCSLAACPTDTPYRVKIATGTSGCLAACTGATPQATECACVKLENSKVTKQSLSTKGQICADGVSAFPVCDLADGKSNTNCKLGATANAATCPDGSYSDGNKCTSNRVGDNEFVGTDLAVCTNTATDAIANPIATGGAAKIKICAQGTVCVAPSNGSAKCETFANIQACTAQKATSTKCKYGKANSEDKYCGPKDGKDHAYEPSLKTCLPKCGTSNNKVACTCVVTSGTGNSVGCRGDQTTCTPGTSGTSDGSAANNHSTCAA